MSNVGSSLKPFSWTTGLTIILSLNFGLGIEKVVGTFSFFLKGTPREESKLFLLSSFDLRWLNTDWIWSFKKLLNAIISFLR